MKKLLISLILVILFITGNSQAVKISDLPAYTGNPAGGLLPLSISGVTKKYDAGSFIFNGGSYSNPSWLTSLHPNKLLSAGAANGQALIWNGSIWTPSTVNVNVTTHTHAQSDILHLSDSILARYNKTQTDALLALKLNLSDTVAMLSNRLKKSDTTNMLSGYSKTGRSVQYSDTASMLSGLQRSGNPVTVSAQPNITSLGSQSNVTVTGTTTTGHLIVTGAAGVSGDLGVTGSLDVNQTIVTGDRFQAINSTSPSTQGTWGYNGNYGSYLFGKLGTSYHNSQFAPDGTFTEALENGTNNKKFFTNIYAPNLFVTGSISGASLSGTLTTSAQPNITSIGSLNLLTIANSLTVNNVYAGNIVKYSDTTNMLSGYARTGNIDISAAGLLRDSSQFLVPNTGYGNRSLNIPNGSINASGSVSGGSLVSASDLNVTSNAYASTFSSIYGNFTNIINGGAITSTRAKLGDLNVGGTALVGGLATVAGGSVSVGGYLNVVSLSTLLGGINVGNSFGYRTTTRPVYYTYPSGELTWGDPALLISDTASILSGYAKNGQVVKYLDTANMLSGYLRTGNAGSGGASPFTGTTNITSSTSGANLSMTGNITTTSAVNSAGLTVTNNATVDGNLTVTGTITAGVIKRIGGSSASVSMTDGSVVTAGSNPFLGNTIIKTDAYGDFNGHTISAQGLVTGVAVIAGSLSTTGATYTGTLSASGNAEVGGNFTVTGVTTIGTAGIFTPTFNNVTADTAIGYYTYINTPFGKQVTVNIFMGYPTTSDASEFRLGGFPFPFSSSYQKSAAVMAMFSNGTGMKYLRSVPGQSYMIAKTNSISSNANQTNNNMINASSRGNFTISFTYFTD